mmetsp:Transcript_13087/g.27791  ORF Transcript_13087/g.27791 Transcript_13087/m.27791 type:complete len:209 (-) Transcript_13087:433-1059(-)
MIAVRSQRHEDGFILSHGEDGTISVRFFQGFQVFDDEIEVLFDDLVGCFGVLVLYQHLVQFTQEILENGNDSGNGRLIVREGIRDNLLSKQIHGHGMGRHGREQRIQMGRLLSQIGALPLVPFFCRTPFLPLRGLRIVPIDGILEILLEVDAAGHFPFALQRALNSVELCVGTVHRHIQRIAFGEVEHAGHLSELVVVMFFHLDDALH